MNSLEFKTIWIIKNFGHWKMSFLSKDSSNLNQIDTHTLFINSVDCSHFLYGKLIYRLNVHFMIESTKWEAQSLWTYSNMVFTPLYMNGRIFLSSFLYLSESNWLSDCGTLSANPLASMVKRKSLSKQFFCVDSLSQQKE